MKLQFNAVAGDDNNDNNKNFENIQTIKHFRRLIYEIR